MWREVGIIIVKMRERRREERGGRETQNKVNNGRSK